MSESDLNSPGSSNNVLEQYKILIDLIKFQHQRLSDWHRTFLTSNTIIISVCAILFKFSESTNIAFETMLFLMPIGFVISLFWLFIPFRINLDTDLRYFQIRYVERILNSEYPIFNIGNEYFKNKKKIDSPDGKENLSFPSEARGFFCKLPVKIVNILLPFMFIFFYIIFLIIMWVYNT